MKIFGIMALLIVFLSSFIAPFIVVNTIALTETSIESKRVENMLELAEKAKVRVELLISNVEINSTLMILIEKYGLIDEFNGNKTLFNEAINIFNMAKNAYTLGNYNLALNYTIQAFELFRLIFRNIHVIVCKAGGCLEKEDVLKAEGLIIAMNRTLERIKSIRSIEGLTEDILAILSEAEGYLNINRARELLMKGNVSEVAHMLAKAEQLVSKAFQMIKSKAYEKSEEKLEKFMGKLNEKCNEVIDKAKSLGINVTNILEIFGFKNVDEIRIVVNNATKNIRKLMDLKQFSRAAHEMNLVMVKLEKMIREMEKVRKKVYEGKFNIDIEVNVEKDVKKQFTTLRITVVNRGNATIVFLNSALGLIIEKKVDDSWKLFYAPIAAQVLTSLKPGQSKHLTIRITTELGIYRIVLRGFCEQTFIPIVKYVEFTIP